MSTRNSPRTTPVQYLICRMYDILAGVTKRRTYSATSATYDAEITNWYILYRLIQHLPEDIQAYNPTFIPDTRSIQVAPNHT